jgi:hypothetical protein
MQKFRIEADVVSFLHESEDIQEKKTSLQKWSSFSRFPISRRWGERLLLCFVSTRGRRFVVRLPPRGMQERFQFGERMKKFE